MNITIIGSGAMACLFAARLAKVTPVSLLGTWPVGLAAIQREGIWVNSITGNSNVRVPVSNNPKRLPQSDIALILVKSYQTERAAQQAAQVLLPTGLAVTLQNGIGNLEALQVVLGAGRVAQGVTLQGASLLEPGMVRAAGGGATYLSGTAEQAAVLQALAGFFQQAGFDTELVPDLAQMQWRKLVANCAINPLTALLRVHNGELLTRPSIVPIFAAAAQEVATVADTLGVPLAFDPIAYAQQVAEQTASNLSSMLQDVLRGGPTEIDVLNGAVVRAARPFGIPTPVNTLLTQLISALTEASAVTN